MELVYEFRYNPSCCESVATTVSIHRTPKGAEMAMEFHKNEVKKEWEEQCAWEKENSDEQLTASYPFDSDQWWGIKETILQD